MVFSIYRKKGGNHGDTDYFSGSRSRNIDFGSPGLFAYAVMAKAWNELFD